MHRIASLRHLQSFETVARLGSVTLAANELHVSQSAISIQIGQLERLFKVQLVARTGRGVRLTEAGQALRGYAERVLGLCAETSEEMAKFGGEFNGTVRIGAVSTAEYWLPKLLVIFAKAHPKIKLKLKVGKRDEIVRALAAEEFDVAVMGQPPRDLSLTAFPFAKNPVGFVVSPQHPLMSRRDLTMAALADAHLLVREPGSGTRTTVERLFREAGLRLRIGSELSSNEAVKHMCVAGFGPAYLSLHTCPLEIAAGLLALLPMPNNPFERDWYVVRLATRPAPPLAAAFEEFLCTQGQVEILRQSPSVPRRKRVPANKIARSSRRLESGR